MTENLQQQRGSALRIFDGREVRAVWHEGEWWYSTVDALAAFADADNPVNYWSTVKRNLKRSGVETRFC